ncbi:hypothetical protein N9315_02405 [Alphaproteobacteria bacterium]|nr:hypothetical protein [Alphaproteobacteria bacterium]
MIPDKILFLLLTYETLKLRHQDHASMIIRQETGVKTTLGE